MFASDETNSEFSSSVKDFLATESNASSGHLKNQSIVQQLTNDGNIRHRRLFNEFSKNLPQREFQWTYLNASPTGLMHIDKCKLLLTLLIKKL